MKANLVSIILIVSLQVPSCLGFNQASCRNSISSASKITPRLTSFPHCVYTPEQEADNSQDNLTASDEVLDSLTKKLDKSSSSASTTPAKKDNKAMAFLKKMGKVGGAANKDFSTAIGSDEGSGMAAPKNSESIANSIDKSKQAFRECTDSGIIDDMSEAFPTTSSGTEWRGVSDRIRGGTSEGFIKREEVEGRMANVLKGHVSLQDNGSGFIQMVTDLPLDPSKNAVDATEYDGIELDVLSREGMTFNVHLRTPGSLQQASYRHTEALEVLYFWQTVRIPFSSFVGDSQDGQSKSVDYSKLKRIGIVVLDQETDVELAVGGVRFYSVL